MQPTWIHDSVFYHIYPLGLCGAPARNNFADPMTPHLEMLHGWLDHMRDLGCNTLYLGPVFESSAHGYDTADFFHVDRRLGDNNTLKSLAQHIKSQGMRLVLDGVFNHVGRDFWAFRDVQQKGRRSAYCDWFYNLNFDTHSPYKDPFAYEGWAGHYDLVKLNVSHPAVRQHLFDAVTFWVQEFDIDGLRLDTADHLDFDFLRALAAHCRGLKPDFWLMGEVVFGDYRQWVNPDMLHSVTNYECYKGLYSSHVDCNYFEIAYSLNRLFGDAGIYRNLPLYSFADNHDVNRVASSLNNPAHLYPLYGLLFTMPGIPSLYYGSEWGIEGKRSHDGDTDLRPAIDLQQAPSRFPHPDLATAIRRFAHLRHMLPALREGDYRQHFVAHEQLAFSRQVEGQTVVVTVNASDQRASIQMNDMYGSHLRDRLNGDETFAIRAGQVTLTLPPNWLRIMHLE